MQLRLLSAADLEEVMDMPTAVDVVARAFGRLSEGKALAPLRTFVEVDRGTMLVMPGWVAESVAGTGEDALGAKVVSVFAGNAAVGRPVVTGVVLLLDPTTGEPRAALNGTWITALRTGAVSGAATWLLAREESSVLAVFGAGVQARTQIRAVRAVRSIEEVRVVSRSRESAERLAGELSGVRAVVATADEAIDGCDVIVAATDSPTPVFPGAAVAPGTHVNGVGSYTPEMREVDADLVRRALVVVDDREAAWAEAGDLVRAVADGVVGRDHVAADLGEVVRGVHPGRTSAEQITFFKSVGNAVQDVSVAAEAVRRAEEAGVGTVIEL